MPEQVVSLPGRDIEQTHRENKDALVEKILQIAQIANEGIENERARDIRLPYLVSGFLRGVEFASRFGQANPQVDTFYNTSKNDPIGRGIVGLTGKKTIEMNPFSFLELCQVSGVIKVEPKISKAVTNKSGRPIYLTPRQLVEFAGIAAVVNLGNYSNSGEAEGWKDVVDIWNMYFKSQKLHKNTRNPLEGVQIEGAKRGKKEAIFSRRGKMMPSGGAGIWAGTFPYVGGSFGAPGIHVGIGRIKGN